MRLFAPPIATVPIISSMGSSHGELLAEYTQSPPTAEPGNPQLSCQTNVRRPRPFVNGVWCWADATFAADAGSSTFHFKIYRNGTQVYYGNLSYYVGGTQCRACILVFCAAEPSQTVALKYWHTKTNSVNVTGRLHAYNGFCAVSRDSLCRIGRTIFMALQASTGFDGATILYEIYDGATYVTRLSALYANRPDLPQYIFRYGQPSLPVYQLYAGFGPYAGAILRSADVYLVVGS
jgi:hypothetical protein